MIKLTTRQHPVNVYFIRNYFAACLYRTLLRRDATQISVFTLIEFSFPIIIRYLYIVVAQVLPSDYDDSIMLIASFPNIFRYRLSANDYSSETLI